MKGYTFLLILSIVVFTLIFIHFSINSCPGSKTPLYTLPIQSFIGEPTPDLFDETITSEEIETVQSILNTLKFTNKKLEENQNEVTKEKILFEKNKQQNIPFVKSKIVFSPEEKERFEINGEQRHPSYQKVLDEFQLKREKYKDRPPVQIINWAGTAWGTTPSKTLNLPNYLGHEVLPQDCGFPCTISDNKQLRPEADALLFSVQQLAGYADDYLNSPPQFPHKEAGQVFINSGYEQPYYFHLYAHPGYLIHHEVNMTFFQWSQVPLSHTCSWGGGTFNDFLTPPKLPKTKFVAWFGTNCNGGGALWRTAYVEELMKYIEIDSFGHCLHNRDLPENMRFPIYSDHGSSMKNKVDIFKEYKFVLAFENNNVTDYVTEKIINVLQAGSVPIYMGAPNIEEWVPPHSIIRTDSFSSPKKLSEYLLWLNENDFYYQEYFKWKKSNELDQFARHYLNCPFYSTTCRLCQSVSDIRHEYETEKMKNLKNKKSPNTDLKGRQFALNIENSYVEIEHPIKLLDLDKAQFTVSFWVKPKEMREMRVIDKAKAGTVDGYTFDLIVHENSLRPRFCALNQCRTSSVSILIGEWSFITFARNPYEIKVYVHSELTDEFTVSGFVQINDYPLRFGAPANGAGSIFNGALDEISIWSYCLSDQEIKKLRFQTLYGREEGLIAYWSFNDGKGQIVVDLGPYHNDGKFDTTKCNWIQSSTKPLVLPRVLPNLALPPYSESLSAIIPPLPPLH